MFACCYIQLDMMNFAVVCCSLLKFYCKVKLIFFMSIAIVYNSFCVYGIGHARKEHQHATHCISVCMKPFQSNFKSFGCNFPSSSSTLHRAGQMCVVRTHTYHSKEEKNAARRVRVLCKKSTENRGDINFDA